MAARFSLKDGTILPEHLIAMAQADKHSVTYDTILNCDTIETELLCYNRTWFRQATDTPFGHGELFQLLGHDGLTEEDSDVKTRAHNNDDRGGPRAPSFRSNDI